MPTDFKTVSRLTPVAAAPAPDAMSPAATEALFIDHGTINFTLHNTTENAEFVLVKPDEPSLHDVALHMIEEWRLEKPGIILRVVGTVDEREMDQMEDVLQGVVHSASEANGFSEPRHHSPPPAAHHLTCLLLPPPSCVLPSLLRGPRSRHLLPHRQYDRG